MVDLPRWDGEGDFKAEFGRVEVGGRRGILPDDVRDAPPVSEGLVLDSVVSVPLRELMADGGLVGVVVELRVRYPGGVEAARSRVADLLLEAGVRQMAASGGYVTATLTAKQVVDLVRRDQRADDGPASSAPRGAIHRLWPNFAIGPLINRSIVTTKCQAAHRSFGASGRDIVWAVLDSGIEEGHAHFRQHRNLDGLPHKSFVTGDDAQALVDRAGHGTHVAGILAGEQTPPEGTTLTAAVWYRNADDDAVARGLQLPTVSGMAPQTRLLSCQVLRPDGSGDITALLAALQYVNELNAGGRELLVHGVNISVGHPFDPRWFATGLTPLCREVDLLVRSGVVVVAAAGNTGYGYARDARNQPFMLAFDMTINDPGNAALALTVGATSCSPHHTGVAYFSSKGPTGDGRLKPDLVAPGERIVSAAAGALLGRATAAVPGATYVESSGTSMAAPHVSGAAAAFLSVHREFVGQPDRVRAALLGSATDLGRAAHFQGAGLVDAMRAIQSV